MATYEALGSRITMDGLLDIVEMKAVRDSWSHAEMLNMDERREHEAKLAALKGAR